MTRNSHFRKSQLTRSMVAVLSSCLVLVALGCSTDKNEDLQTAPTQSTGSNVNEYKYSELHSVADFQLTERNEKPFGTEDLKGKVWIASFFFTSCKFECSDQNNTISKEIHAKLSTNDFTILSISCDPTNDTPKVLSDYADSYVIAPEKWKFLTGPMESISSIGSDSFMVGVDRLTHTKRLLMVDKWGRFRDSFEWKDADELKRLVKTAKMLIAEESEPEPDEIVKTRAVPHSSFEIVAKTNSKSGSKKDSATVDASKATSSSVPDPNWPSWRTEEWLTSFKLTDSKNQTFDSNQMKGKVWVANFFFSNCTGACPKLLNGVKELRQQLGNRDVTFVSITNDPLSDTPKVLNEYAKKYNADSNWHFLTGKEQLQMRAIGSEFFNVNAGTGETHSEKLIVVDKWGKVRGQFKYDDADDVVKMRLLLDDLLSEKEPPKSK